MIRISAITLATRSLPIAGRETESKFCCIVSPSLLVWLTLPSSVCRFSPRFKCPHWRRSRDGGFQLCGFQDATGRQCRSADLESVARKPVCQYPERCCAVELQGGASATTVRRCWCRVRRPEVVVVVVVVAMCAAVCAPFRRSFVRREVTSSAVVRPWLSSCMGKGDRAGAAAAAATQSSRDS